MLSLFLHIVKVSLKCIKLIAIIIDFSIQLLFLRSFIVSLNNYNKDLRNLKNICIDIYELDPAHFLSALGLAGQVCLKKTGIKLELLYYYWLKKELELEYVM